MLCDDIIMLKYFLRTPDTRRSPETATLTPTNRLVGLDLALRPHGWLRSGRPHPTGRAPRFSDTKGLTRLCAAL